MPSEISKTWQLSSLNKILTLQNVKKSFCAPNVEIWMIFLEETREIPAECADMFCSPCSVTAVVFRITMTLNTPV